jgi:hypothetical protein
MLLATEPRARLAQTDTVLVNWDFTFGNLVVADSNMCREKPKASEHPNQTA